MTVALLTKAIRWKWPVSTVLSRICWLPLSLPANILQNKASRVAQVLYLHVSLSWYVGNRLERDNPLSHNTVSNRSPEVYRILSVKL